MGHKKRPCKNRTQITLIGLIYNDQYLLLTPPYPPQGAGPLSSFILLKIKRLLVPTLCVGTCSRTLRVQYAAERQEMHSDAEHRNENLTALPLGGVRGV